MNERDMTDSEVSESLRGLRETVSGLGAGPRVEETLALEFQRNRLPARVAQKQWWPKWALVAAAAAVLVAVGVVPLMRRENAPPAPVAVSQPPAAQTEVREPATVTAPPRRIAPRTVRPAQTAGEFIPLVPDLRWEPGEGGQIVRVSFPRAALQSFGLPVNENRTSEMVSADILVGQDMVARAIRVIR